MELEERSEMGWEEGSRRRGARWGGRRGAGTGRTEAGGGWEERDFRTCGHALVLTERHVVLP